jgi:hypothetical protein
VPLPKDLTDSNATKHLQVWSGPLGVATGGQKRTKIKTFTSFIEIFEQSAHDSGLRQLALQRGITPRRAHKGRVTPANPGTDNVAYYATHGEEAAKMAGEWITSKWEETVATNNSYWVRGMKQTLTWQSKRRANGFSYEITLWYADTECYTAFHCYLNT